MATTLIVNYAASSYEDEGTVDSSIFDETEDNIADDEQSGDTIMRTLSQFRLFDENGDSISLMALNEKKGRKISATGIVVEPLPLEWRQAILSNLTTVGKESVQEVSNPSTNLLARFEASNVNVSSSTTTEADAAGASYSSADIPKLDRSQFMVGEPLDGYCNRTFKWYAAKVTEVKKDKKKIKVHFLGWHSKFDEWLDYTSERIAAKGTSAALMRAAEKASSQMVPWYNPEAIELQASSVVNSSSSSKNNNGTNSNSNSNSNSNRYPTLRTHPVKIEEVEDWCIDYAYPNPTLWLISSSGVWYRIAGALCTQGGFRGSPHFSYVSTFQPVAEKFFVASHIVMCILDIMGTSPAVSLQVVCTEAAARSGGKVNELTTLLHADFLLEQLQDLSEPAEWGPRVSIQNSNVVKQLQRDGDELNKEFGGVEGLLAGGGGGGGDTTNSSINNRNRADNGADSTKNNSKTPGTASGGVKGMTGLKRRLYLLAKQQKVEERKRQQELEEAFAELEDEEQEGKTEDGHEDNGDKEEKNGASNTKNGQRNGDRGKRKVYEGAEGKYNAVGEYADDFEDNAKETEFAPPVLVKVVDKPPKFPCVDERLWAYEKRVNGIDSTPLPIPRYSTQLDVPTGYAYRFQEDTSSSSSSSSSDSAPPTNNSEDANRVSGASFPIVSSTSGNFTCLSNADDVNNLLIVWTNYVNIRGLLGDMPYLTMEALKCCLENTNVLHPVISELFAKLLAVIWEETIDRDALATPRISYYHSTAQLYSLSDRGEAITDLSFLSSQPEEMLNSPQSAFRSNIALRSALLLIDGADGSAESRATIDKDGCQVPPSPDIASKRLNALLRTGGDAWAELLRVLVCEHHRMDDLSYTNWKVECETFVAQLLRDPECFPFGSPVEPDKYGLVGYFQVVTEPMDLGTILDRIICGWYDPVTVTNSSSTTSDDVILSGVTLSTTVSSLPTKKKAIPFKLFPGLPVDVYHEKLQCWYEGSVMSVQQKLKKTENDPVDRRHEHQGADDRDGDDEEEEVTVRLVGWGYDCDIVLPYPDPEQRVQPVGFAATEKTRRRTPPKELLLLNTGSISGSATTDISQHLMNDESAILQLAPPAPTTASKGRAAEGVAYDMRLVWTNCTRYYSSFEGSEANPLIATAKHNAAVFDAFYNKRIKSLVKLEAQQMTAAMLSKRDVSRSDSRDNVNGRDDRQHRYSDYEEGESKSELRADKGTAAEIAGEAPQPVTREQSKAVPQCSLHSLVNGGSSREQQAAANTAAAAAEAESAITTGCHVCHSDENEHLIILCDMPGCNVETHFYCATPAISELPEGDWFCGVCMQAAEEALAAMEGRVYTSNTTFTAADDENTPVLAVAATTAAAAAAVTAAVASSSSSSRMGTSEATGIALEQTACHVCGRSDNEHLIVLCDTPGCPIETHFYCATPVLTALPEGDWYCGVCNGSSKTTTSGNTKSNDNATVTDNTLGSSYQFIPDNLLKQQLQSMRTEHARAFFAGQRTTSHPSGTCINSDRSAVKASISSSSSSLSSAAAAEESIRQSVELTDAVTSRHWQHIVTDQLKSVSFVTLSYTHKVQLLHWTLQQFLGTPRAVSFMESIHEARLQHGKEQRAEGRARKEKKDIKDKDKDKDKKLQQIKDKEVDDPAVARQRASSSSSSSSTAGVLPLPAAALAAPTAAAAAAPTVEKLTRSAMKKILKVLGEQEYVDVFAYPVNLKEVPGYSDLIERPMDLSTVKANIKDGLYDDNYGQGFVEDVRLIWSNCRQFNLPDSEIVGWANALSDVFEDLVQGYVAVSPCSVAPSVAPPPAAAPAPAAPVLTISLKSLKKRSLEAITAPTAPTAPPVPAAPAAPPVPVAPAAPPAAPAAGAPLVYFDESFCHVCGKSDNEDQIVLCDTPGCPIETHFYCACPVITELPEGDWFCSVCDGSANASANAPAATTTTPAGTSKGGLPKKAITSNSNSKSSSQQIKRGRESTDSYISSNSSSIVVPSSSSSSAAAAAATAVIGNNTECEESEEGPLRKRGRRPNSKYYGETADMSPRKVPKIVTVASESAAAPRAAVLESTSSSPAKSAHMKKRQEDKDEKKLAPPEQQRQEKVETRTQEEEAEAEALAAAEAAAASLAEKKRAAAAAASAVAAALLSAGTAACGDFSEEQHKLVLRHMPLGEDRYHNIYWAFHHDPVRPQIYCEVRNKQSVTGTHPGHEVPVLSHRGSTTSKVVPTGGHAAGSPIRVKREEAADNNHRLALFSPQSPRGIGVNSATIAATATAASDITTTTTTSTTTATTTTALNVATHTIPWVEAPTWFVYSQPFDLFCLYQWLSDRGIREMKLKNSILLWAAANNLSVSSILYGPPPPPLSSTAAVPAMTTAVGAVASRADGGLVPAVTPMNVARSAVDEASVLKQAHDSLLKAQRLELQAENAYYNGTSSTVGAVAGAANDNGETKVKRRYRRRSTIADSSGGDGLINAAGEMQNLLITATAAGDGSGGGADGDEEGADGDGEGRSKAQQQRLLQQQRGAAVVKAHCCDFESSWGGGGGGGSSNSNSKSKSLSEDTYNISQLKQQQQQYILLTVHLDGNTPALGVAVKEIQGRIFVTGFRTETARLAGVRPGDELFAVDGQLMKGKLALLAHFFAALYKQRQQLNNSQGGLTPVDVSLCVVRSPTECRIPLFTQLQDYGVVEELKAQIKLDMHKQDAVVLQRVVNAGNSAGWDWAGSTPTPTSTSITPTMNSNSSGGVGSNSNNLYVLPSFTHYMLESAREHNRTVNAVMELLRETNNAFCCSEQWVSSSSAARARARASDGGGGVSNREEEEEDDEDDDEEKEIYSDPSCECEKHMSRILTALSALHVATAASLQGEDCGARTIDASQRALVSELRSALIEVELEMHVWGNALHTKWTVPTGNTGGNDAGYAEFAAAAAAAVATNNGGGGAAAARAASRTTAVSAAAAAGQYHGNSQTPQSCWRGLLRALSREKVEDSTTSSFCTSFAHIALCAASLSKAVVWPAVSAFMNNDYQLKKNKAQQLVTELERAVPAKLDKRGRSSHSVMSSTHSNFLSAVLKEGTVVRYWHTGYLLAQQRMDEIMRRDAGWCDDDHTNTKCSRSRVVSSYDSTADKTDSHHKNSISEIRRDDKDKDKDSGTQEEESVYFTAAAAKEEEKERKKRDREAKNKDMLSLSRARCSMYNARRAEMGRRQLGFLPRQRNRPWGQSSTEAIEYCLHAAGWAHTVHAAAAAAASGDGGGDVVDCAVNTDTIEVGKDEGIPCTVSDVSVYRCWRQESNVLDAASTTMFAQVTLTPQKCTAAAAAVGEEEEEGCKTGVAAIGISSSGAFKTAAEKKEELRLMKLCRQLQTILTIINRTNRVKNFKSPVCADTYPEYYKHVINPMDLETIAARAKYSAATAPPPAAAAAGAGKGEGTPRPVGRPRKDISGSTAGGSSGVSSGRACYRTTAEFLADIELIYYNTCTHCIGDPKALKAAALQILEDAQRLCAVMIDPMTATGVSIPPTTSTSTSTSHSAVLDTNARATRRGTATTLSIPTAGSSYNSSGSDSIQGGGGGGGSKCFVVTIPIPAAAVQQLNSSNSACSSLLGEMHGPESPFLLPVDSFATTNITAATSTSSTTSTANNSFYLIEEEWLQDLAAGAKTSLEQVVRMTVHARGTQSSSSSSAAHTAAVPLASMAPPQAGAAIGSADMATAAAAAEEHEITGVVVNCSSFTTSSATSTAAAGGGAKTASNSASSSLEWNCLSVEWAHNTDSTLPRRVNPWDVSFSHTY